MSNLLKSGSIAYREEETRIIDSNELIASKIEKLSSLLEETNSEAGFEDDFLEGLDTFQVERLLSGEDESEESQIASVIKKMPVYEGPGPEEIIEKARAEAEEIIEDAITEASQKKESVYEDARQKGYEEGYQEALRKTKEREQELDNKEKELEKSYEKRIEELEPMFIENLTEIYEHIFHVQFAGNKEVIFYLLQEAVRKIEGSKNFIIHISKEDFGFVSMQKKELLSGIAGAVGAEIVEDMTLKANECFIETGNGIFDCSLETQLTGLARELKLLSYRKE